VVTDMWMITKGNSELKDLAASPVRDLSSVVTARLLVICPISLIVSDPIKWTGNSLASGLVLLSSLGVRDVIQFPACISRNQTKSG